MSELASVLAKLELLTREVQELRAIVTRHGLKGRRAAPAGPQQALSCRAVARALGISRETTLPDLIREGKIRAVSVAGKVKIPAEELERVLAEGTEPLATPRRQTKPQPVWEPSSAINARLKARGL